MKKFGSFKKFFRRVKLFCFLNCHGNAGTVRKSCSAELLIFVKKGASCYENIQKEENFSLRYFLPGFNRVCGRGKNDAETQPFKPKRPVNQTLVLPAKNMEADKTARKRVFNEHVRAFERGGIRCKGALCGQNTRKRREPGE